MFGKVRKLHFVGIGGIGMSGIAELLINQGFEISGSDLQLSEVTQRLSELGARVDEGHSAALVGEADVVVISSAVKQDNPEVMEARRRKIPVIRRAEMLGELMRMKFSVGIAGTHGKTTTPSIVGLVLSQAGLDPTIIVGGKVRSLRTSAKLGGGEYLVAEADEFDRSFLRMFPTIAVVTTLEAEHLDCYTNLDDIKGAFVEYVNKVPFYGAVILCLDEKSLQSIIPSIGGRLLTYGLSPQADVRGTALTFDGLNSAFDVQYRGDRLGRITLKVPGVHNVKNCLAAIAVGLELGRQVSGHLIFVFQVNDLVMPVLTGGLGHQFTADPLDWRLAGRIDIGDDKHIGLEEGSAEVLAEIPGPAEQMRLEDGNGSPAQTLLGRLEGRLDLGGMMRVVIHYQHIVDLPLDLKAAIDPGIFL